MNGVAIAELVALVDLGRDALATGVVVFLRIGAAMALLPAFGEQIVPMRVRLALALAFTLVVAPAVAAEAGALAAAPSGLPRALLTESVAGLVLGLALRLLVIALQVAGTMAAQATSLAQFFGGAGVDPQPAISQVLVMAGLTLALMAGLHVRLAELLILSYALLPAGTLPGPAVLGGWGVGHVAQTFALAFSLAAPFVIGALIYNMALGAINRAMPQLMVAFVGAPALTAGGLILLVLVVPAAMAVWLGALGDFFATPFAGRP
jgi:flagellar biosynthesis protein FliR